MTEHPILVNDQVSRNIRAGLQTQDRRPMKVQPSGKVVDVRWDGHSQSWAALIDPPCGSELIDGALRFRSPYGTAGDRLWFREAHEIMFDMGEGLGHPCEVVFRSDFACHPCHNETPLGAELLPASGYSEPCHPYWRPSIHMPRWACRTTAIVKRVWVERIGGISEEDARAEGIDRPYCAASAENYYTAWVKGKCIENQSAVSVFEHLWSALYPGSWDRNEWVWCCEFEVER